MIKKYLLIIMLVFICNIKFLECRDRSNNIKLSSRVKKIVPKEGFRWPNKIREYWPTNGWKKAEIIEQWINQKKMKKAENIAQNDTYFRSLLVIRNGLIVYEKYFHGGGETKSTEVWSVTKSFTSALIGIAIDKGFIKNVDKLMRDYLSQYEKLKNIRIKHVLTHSTGLNWNEGSMQTWIESENWFSNALNRGFFTHPGKTLLYSSANSHLLSLLLYKTTGEKPGSFANRHLFIPLGIKYEPLKIIKKYINWNELHNPLPGSWRQDNMGLEIGAFGLNLTAREMAKFGFLYLNRGNWDGKTIISEKWVEDSTRDRFLRNNTFGFGYHWVVAKRMGQISFDADGWGGQHISVIPELDMIIVIKCDAVNPGGRSSYRVLNQTIEAALN